MSEQMSNLERPRAPGRIGEALLAVARVLHTGRRTGVAECRVEAEGDRLPAPAAATFIVHLPESQS
jgi:acyl-coenzyme A thioesterase PaaI-like protein